MRPIGLRRLRSLHVFAGLTLAIALLSGCAKSDEGAGGNGPRRSPEDEVAAVETAIAQAVSTEEAPEYVGTTEPAQEVSLRAQVEGRVLQLQVDAGDRVNKGQRLAQLDASLLVAATNQARAELAALESELAQAEVQVSTAATQLERAKLELQQAKNDAERFSRLAAEGATNRQQAESAVTAYQVAQQVVRAAEKQIGVERKAVAAALGRVAAQKAAIAQARQRQSYATLVSPIAGVVLERTTEPGNFVGVGGEVLRLGNFQQIKAIVPVSELELAGIRSGQTVQVTLDAFPNQVFEGRVSRISPAADPTTRQIPVEVIFPNTGGRIGSGLLARVRFPRSRTLSQIAIPRSALDAGNEGKAAKQKATKQQKTATIFTITSLDEAARQATVTARTITLASLQGKPTQSAASATNGQLFVQSGLRQGERFVASSSRPLQDGETVRLSILSE